MASWFCANKNCAEVSVKPLVHLLMNSGSRSVEGQRHVVGVDSSRNFVQ